MNLGLSAPGNADSQPLDIYDADAVLAEVAPEIEEQKGAEDRYERINIGSETSRRMANSGLSVQLRANEVNPRSDFSRTPDTTIDVPFAEREVATSDTESVWSTDSPDSAFYLSETVSGARFLTVLGSASASTSYEYNIDVPEGSSAESTQHGLTIIGPNNEHLGNIVTPWVRDSQGNDVAATYEWDDGTLIQRIDTASVSANAYPVVAQAAWSYAYQWEILNKTVAQNRYNLQDCFNCYFPVNGAPAHFPFYLESLPLTVTTIPPFSADFSCIMGPSTWRDDGSPRLQQLEWSFMADQGHVDGLGSSISFTIAPLWEPGAPVAETFSRLYVSAYIVNSNPLGVPRSVYEAGAVLNWTNFANNLNNA